MREVQSSEAKTHFSRLLDDAEGGETIVITRHGRAIARLIPDPDRRREAVERAFAQLDKLRKNLPRLTVEEIIALRDEGRKY